MKAREWTFDDLEGNWPKVSSKTKLYSTKQGSSFPGYVVKPESRENNET